MIPYPSELAISTALFAMGWSTCCWRKFLIGVIWLAAHFIPFFRLDNRLPPDSCFARLTDIDSRSSITFKVSSFDKSPIYVELLPCCVINTPGFTTRTTNSYSFAFHAYLCWLAAVTMTWRENCPMFPGASNSCGSWMVRPKSRTKILPGLRYCLW